MYILNEDQLAAVQSLIDKLDDSIIKARIEKWLEEINPEGSVSGEKMEQFQSFAVHLPKEFQNLPIYYVTCFKNGLTPESETAAVKSKTKTAKKK